MKTCFSCVKGQITWRSITAFLLVLVITVICIPTTVLAAAKDIQLSDKQKEELNEVYTDSEVKSYDADIYDESEIIAEDTSRRTETSKTFVQADGTLVMQDYGVPEIHLRSASDKMSLKSLLALIVVTIA